MPGTESVYTLIRVKRLRWQFALVLLIGIAIGLAVAFGITTVQQVIDKLAEKALEISIAALLSVAGSRL